MSKPFTPPKNWPNANTERAVDAMADKAQAVAASMRDPSAREAAYQAVDALRRAYSVEMEARLALWRSLGYQL